MDYKLCVADSLIDTAQSLEDAVEAARQIYDVASGEDIAIWESGKLVAVLQPGGSLWLPPGVVISLNPVAPR